MVDRRDATSEFVDTLVNELRYAQRTSGLQLDYEKIEILTNTHLGVESDVTIRIPRKAWYEPRQSEDYPQ